MQANLIKTINKSIPGDGNSFIPIEKMSNDFVHLEQYAAKVLNYTSKYNISFSISYSPDNLVGAYQKYPAYGDFVETYFLRSYGKWWSQSEACQADYMPKDCDPVGAEDYVTLGFEYPVLARDVCIYEIYNPGAVVRLWGRHTSRNWKLLWEGPPQECTLEARKFHPEIKKYNCLINEIRLEFNQRRVKYHTSIDAVLLAGYSPKNLYGSSSAVLSPVLREDLFNFPCPPLKRLSEEIPEKSTPEVTEVFDPFARLPYEVILHIFQNLDLRSLTKCAQVSKSWRQATLDPILYQNLSLKRYWHRIDERSLEFFRKRCRGLRRLDISWCGTDEDPDGILARAFVEFSKFCCKNLTHLSACHCKFINNYVVENIAKCQEITELRLRSVKVDPIGFQHISVLQKLITLDLCSTNITDEPLTKILKSNKNLRHLMLDFCESLEELDKIAEVVAKGNKNLTTWTSFKCTTLTSNGAGFFALCPNLKELDLGWCFLLTHPGDCLEKIADGCRNLQRLIISQWRGITDQMLLSVIINCKNLTQIDLLGIKSITNEICERALSSLPKLRLLDISFCKDVDNDQVKLWRVQYPEVTIQRSCQFVDSDF